MIQDRQIERILERLDELERLMSQRASGEDYVRLSKEYAELSPVADGARAVRDTKREAADLQELLADPEAGTEMRALVEAERQTLDERLAELETALRLLLLPSDVADEKNAILEIRAGTGGDEAALFAGDLMRMYQRYAEGKSWKVEFLSLNETDLGGIKEAVIAIAGKGVFARLKFESGVHRVQRVPETESGGRIHTSAATVAVLPEAEDIDVEIDENDLRVDTYRAQGAGGQHVNTTDSAVRITHEALGIVVTCQDEKSQHKNRAKAMKILRARVYEAERQAQADDRAAQRRSQVGSGDRSERIRTYNFPQGRITDHRINLTLYKLDRMLSGEAVDEVVDALVAHDQAERLAEADG